MNHHWYLMKLDQMLVRNKIPAAEADFGEEDLDGKNFPDSHSISGNLPS
jgi:hypothetical protein